MNARARHLRVAPVETEVRADPRGAGLVELVRRRISGDYELDAWGLDDDLAEVAGRLAALRWAIDVDGLSQLPESGPALLVANRRLGWSEPVVVAAGVLQATGRVVRPVGGLGVDPFQGVLRRLGALPGQPGEVAAALRAGNLVLVPTRREPVRGRAGHLPIELVAAGIAEGAPLLPVAVHGWELGRHWQVRLGAPVEVERRRGPARAVGGVDPRQVGAAAVAVATALDELLERGPGGPLGRRLASVVGSGRPPRRLHAVDEWQGT